MRRSSREMDNCGRVDATRPSHVSITSFTVALLMTLVLCIMRPAPIRTPFTLLHRRWKLNAFPLSPFSITIFRGLTSSTFLRSPTPPSPRQNLRATIRENIYTLPNILTVSRILSCPVLGWSIIDGNFKIATSLLVYAGITDWVSIFLVSVNRQ